MGNIGPVALTLLIGVRAALRMQLQHVCIGNRVIGAHMLPAELSTPPNACEFECAREIRVHPHGHIQHGVAAAHRKGPMLVKGLAGRLGIDAHDPQDPEEERADFAQSSPAGRGGCERRKAYAEQVFEDGRVFRIGKVRLVGQQQRREVCAEWIHWRQLRRCWPALRQDDLSGGKLPQDPLQLFRAFVRLFAGESHIQPLLLMFEDLQWLDSETDAFLAYLAGRVSEASILLLLNYRTEHNFRWGHQHHCTELRLDPLVSREAQGLLSSLLGDDPALGSLRKLVLEKTEGNPFFMEEVVRTLVEEKTLLGDAGRYRIDETPAALQIPATVQGVLATRMDRLPYAQRSLLQTLAVIGKEFPLSLIRQVTGLEDDSLYPLLEGLQAGEFIYGRAAFPECGYAFKHALTQEVAGNALLSEQRRTRHERTGRAIEALFCDQLKDHCSELAHHYSLSGNLPKAVEYLHCACRQAVERSAYPDAIRHVGAALELLDRLPDTPGRARVELALRVTLGPALIAAVGYASAEAEANYTRAMDLCDHDPDAPEQFEVKLGLRTFFSLRARHQTAFELGEALLGLAGRARDPALLAEAHIALGGSSFFMGRFKEARAYLEQGLGDYETEPHPAHTVRYGHDAGVRGHSFLAWVLWYLGFPMQASRHADKALELARNVSHPFSLALGLTFAAKLYQCTGQISRLRECAEGAIKLSTEQGFPFCRAFAAILHGWAVAKGGSAEEGIAGMRRGLNAFEATGSELGRPYFMGLLAEAYGNAGRVGAGLELLDDGLRMASGVGERYHEAELHRLKGVLLLQPSCAGARCPSAEAAEACFHQAVGIARRQGAISLELRATLNLVRLWRAQGKTEAARQASADAMRIAREARASDERQQACRMLHSVM